MTTAPLNMWQCKLSTAPAPATPEPVAEMQISVIVVLFETMQGQREIDVSGHTKDWMKELMRSSRQVTGCMAK
jgi:hypothetical protein